MKAAVLCRTAVQNIVRVIRMREDETGRRSVKLGDSETSSRIYSEDVKEFGKHRCCARIVLTFQGLKVIVGTFRFNNQ